MIDPVGETAGTRGLPRPRRVLVAWALWVCTLVLAIIGIVTAGPSTPTGLGQALALSLGALSATTMGAILVTRLSQNKIGWLLVAGGFASALTQGAGGLAYIGLVMSPGSVPGAIWFLWFSNWVWAPYIVCLAFLLPLLFPTGHLPSPRWRPVAAAGLAVIVVASIQSAFSPFTGSFPTPLANPLALTGWAADVLSLASVATAITGLICLPLIVGSLVLRYRRSVGIERQQLKWFAYTMAFIAPGVFLGLLLSSSSDGVLATIANVSWGVASIGLGLLPVAIGLAILRYKLYAIDLVIRRTLVYGVLGVLLGGAYVGSVLLLSAVLAPITSGNSLAVAGSTLLVAALFQPVRRRIQARVDRRFFRSRYNATQELAAFGARLRDQVDLAQLSTEIAGTVERTLSPVSGSLWLQERGP